jgi:epoxyqueuosine reductase
MKCMLDPDPILLHTCCGPCATACIESLSSTAYRPVLFFSNSNIFPEEEYLTRLDNAVKLAGVFGLTIVQDAYDHEAWLQAVSGLENEPERGARCARCFAFSFGRTAVKAGELAIPSFATTLTVSRYKSSGQIFEAGKAFPGFKPIDFKKDDGYALSIRLSRLYGLYRQRYCGCEFSMK